MVRRRPNIALSTLLSVIGGNGKLAQVCTPPPPSCQKNTRGIILQGGWRVDFIKIIQPGTKEINQQQRRTSPRRGRGPVLRVTTLYYLKCPIFSKKKKTRHAKKQKSITNKYTRGWEVGGTGNGTACESQPDVKLSKDVTVAAINSLTCWTCSQN